MPWSNQNKVESIFAIRFSKANSLCKHMEGWWAAEYDGSFGRGWEPATLCNATFYSESDIDSVIEKIRNGFAGFEVEVVKFSGGVVKRIKSKPAPKI